MKTVKEVSEWFFGSGVNVFEEENCFDQAWLESSLVTERNRVFQETNLEDQGFFDVGYTDMAYFMREFKRDGQSLADGYLNQTQFLKKWGHCRPLTILQQTLASALETFEVYFLTDDQWQNLLLTPTDFKQIAKKYTDAEIQTFFNSKELKATLEQLFYTYLLQDLKANVVSNERGELIYRVPTLTLLQTVCRADCHLNAGILYTVKETKATEEFIFNQYRRWHSTTERCIQAFIEDTRAIKAWCEATGQTYPQCFFRNVYNTMCRAR